MSLMPMGIVVAATAALAQPQTERGASPTFEVASIKASGPQSIRGSEGGPGSSDPGRYRFNAATLQDLLAIGYNVEYFQISSPAPLDRQTFDLVAIVPDGATKQDFRVMLQNLLAQRFHLKLHIQWKEFAAYELVVAKSGAKLKETVGGTGASALGTVPPAQEGWPDLAPDRPGMAARNSVSGGFQLVRLRARQEPLSVLAQILGRTTDLPVMDMTGLNGRYDFTLEYTTELPNAPPNGKVDPPIAPSLFSALQQQLGLQLVQKKVPFDVLIIESVDSLPTEN